MDLNVEQFNAAATSWKDGIVSEIKTVGAGMGIRHRKNSPSPSASLPKVRGRVGMKKGIVERISISFPRQLIYTQYGAGKGRGGEKGSRWIDKYGQTQKTDSKSLGKAGTGGRTAKPLFSTALNGPNGVDKLATIAATEIGAAITDTL